MNDNLIIRLFLDEDFDALNNTVRWNGKARIKDETVGHHTYIVTVFARVLLEEMLDPNDRMSPEDSLVADALKLELMTDALFHDFDETIVGDILYNVKYNEHNGDNIRSVLRDFVNFSLDRKFNKQLPSDRMVHNSLTRKVAFNKNFVKLCDWLSVVYYISKEMSLGNKRFRHNWYLAVVALKTLANQIVEEQAAIKETYGLPMMRFASIELLSKYDYEQIIKNYE